MSDLTLGLDLGPTSIGWAVVDDRLGRVTAAGVRVFPEGVDRDQQGGEKSKMQTRRDARGMRRQIARRAHRKGAVSRLLAEAGLLPTDPGERQTVLALNPYPLRARALDDRLEPHEIGRAFLHLNQRRGFLSNRKTDKARAKDTKGMLAEISELAKAIERAGCRTLGEYLAKLDERFEDASSADEQRVRHRHTRRDMYEGEFDAIWRAQQKWHPTLLNDELKERLRRIIFFQRKMYWPKSVVGRCELELKEKRCPRADRAAQRFRLVQEVNNLRFLDSATGEERALDEQERLTLLEYLSAARERSFDQIRKKLAFSEHVRFNYERAERSKLKGHQTDAALGAKKALGSRWKGLPAEAKDAIVDVLIHEEREDEALRLLGEDCGLDREEAERALAVNLAEGYMSFSRVAIERLLPHLERGLLLMAEDESNSALHAAGYPRPDQRAVRERRFLPPPPDLPNPIVRQALVEVRKLVNAVIRGYGRPDRIHVELAREAKKSLEQRTQIRVDNARRSREREEAAKQIREMGFEPTGSDKNRYRLWREQGEYCVYCAKKISQAQLFSGETNVDHVLPRWRSLDDSLANKVVCHRRCNDEKGDQTPREWLEESDPKRYALVLRIADRLPYGKRRKFLQKDIVLDEFVSRQLTDTAYISRCVTQYLRCLGARIVTPRGRMTADLRHYWGLNKILDSKGRGEKNRADHRHHAIDAIVIALTDQKRLFALANDRGKNVSPPWEGFREGVERSIVGINVSHRVQRRLSGALHEATFYGATQKATVDAREPVGGPRRSWAKGWTEDHGVYVRRKPVTEIKNHKHLEKVRDAAIRNALREHLRAQSVDPDRSGTYPGTVFKGENRPRMPSGVPIKKVRMLEESETFCALSERRSFHHVKPGNNHHIVYRAVGNGESAKWTAEVVTMWDAALRGRNGLPIVDRADNENGRFVMSLCINELFEIDVGDGRRALCVVRKTDQRSKRINYKFHTDARKADEINKDNLYLSPRKMQLLKARKVTVDLLGRIRRASD